MNKQELIAALITPEKFLLERPAMNAFTIDEIQEGIYTAFNLINAECRGLPIEVWAYNEPAYRPVPVPVDSNNVLYRTTHEIDQFYQAIVTQTHYNLNMGNDYSQGSSTFSTGGMSATIQRPERRDILAAGVLLFLQNARLYKMQDYDIKTKSDVKPCDELNKYLTKDVADMKYVAISQEEAEIGSVATIDRNHQVIFQNPNEIDFKSVKADTILDTDGQYKRIQDISNLAFYGPGGADAMKRNQVREMVDASHRYSPTWSYRKGEIITTYDESKGLIRRWMSNYDNNIDHDPILDNPGQYWWKEIVNLNIDAKRIWDPVDEVYRLINEFNVHYFGGLTENEIKDLIHTSGTVWNPDLIYRQGFVVVYVDSTNALGWYESLQDNNIGHNPETETTWWKKLPIPAIDVSSVIEQLKPYIKEEIDTGINSAINQYKTALTTDFKGSIYSFQDNAAFEQFIRDNEKLTADMFESVDITENYYPKNETYSKQEANNLFPTKQEVVNLTDNQNINGEKNFSNLKTGNYSFEAENNAFRLTPNATNKWLYFGNPNSNYFQGIDLNNRVSLLGIKTPTRDNEAANKAYVDANTVNPQNYYTKSQSDSNYYSKSYVNSNFYTKSSTDGLIRTIYNEMFPVGSVVMTCDGSTHQMVRLYPSSFQEITSSDSACLAIGTGSGFSGSNNYYIKRSDLPNVTISHNHSFSYDTRRNIQGWNFGTGGQVWDAITTKSGYTDYGNLYLNGDVPQTYLNLKPKTVGIRMWKVIRSIK